jgi:hypothetical protein
MESNVANTKYGIVLGAPRSGTTFLMGFLNAMPDTEAVTGNLLPTVIPHLMNQELPEMVRVALTSAFGRVLSDYLESGAFNSRSAALHKWVLAGGDLRKALAGRRSVDRLVYKEPFLAFAPQYTYEALPKARLVYLLRDGRDVADSLVRSYDVLSDDKLSHLNTTEAPIGRKRGDRYVPWWVDDGREDEFLSAPAYVRAIWMWSAMVSRCRAFFSRDAVAGEGRVLQIRYEDLIRDPVSWGGRIADHFGVPMTRRMGRQIASAHASSVGIHKRRDPKELEEATRVAGDELRQQGYL